MEVSVTDETEKSQKTGHLDRLLKDSETFRTMQVLLGQYILLEQYFMAQSVQKVRYTNYGYLGACIIHLIVASYLLWIALRDTL